MFLCASSLGRVFQHDSYDVHMLRLFIGRLSGFIADCHGCGTVRLSCVASP